VAGNRAAHHGGDGDEAEQDDERAQRGGGRELSKSCEHAGIVAAATVPRIGSGESIDLRLLLPRDYSVLPGGLPDADAAPPGLRSGG